MARCPSCNTDYSGSICPTCDATLRSVERGMFTLPRPQLAVYVVAALAVAWVATRYVGSELLIDGGMSL